MSDESASEPRRKVRLVVAAWLAMLWGLVAFDMWQMYGREQREATLQSQSLALAMEEYAQRTVLALDFALLGVVDDLSSHHASRQEVGDGAGHAIKHVRNVGTLGAITFLDAQGMVVAASDANVPADKSFASREYFSVHLARPDLGLYVASPIRGAISGRPFLPLSRRVNDAAGNFLGVVVGLLDARGVAEHFSRHKIGDHGGMGLIHTVQKRVIARYPNFEATFGADLGASPVSAVFDGKATEGLLDVESTLDSRSRRVAYRHLAGLPLLVAVGFDQQDVRWAVLTDMSGYLAMVLLMSLATLLLGRRLERSQMLLVENRLRLQQELLERTVAEQRLQSSEQAFRSMADHVPGAMYRCQIEAPWRVTFISDGIKELCGVAAEEFLSLRVTYGDLIHPDDLGLVERVVAQGVASRHSYEVRYRVLHRDGSTRWMHEIGRAIYDAEGTARFLDGVIIDISRIKHDEEKLREAARVFEVSSDAIVITDPRGVIKSVNPAFTEITGYSAAEAIGQTPRFLKSGRHGSEFYQRLWAAIDREGLWEGEIWNRRKSGEIYPEWQTISAVRNEDGQVSEYISQFSDITRRKLTEEEIRHRANYDALTGLPNRSLLIERLEQAVLKSQRESGRFALLFLDLDQFKQVNDSLGHAIGDRLLEQVASRLVQCVREVDTVARQGGDEFVILLSRIENAAGAEIVAEKCLEALKEPFDLDHNEVHIGVSIGIAMYPDDGDSVESLFRDADLAMYRAKESGRNTFQFFEASMTESVMARRHLEADLRHAAERGELAIHYQPVVDFRSGQVTGAEALMRWNHPERGAVPPDVFIPLAEDLGLIRGMGRWVVETACEQLAIWHREGRDIYSMAVNVSSRQIPDGLSVEWLQVTLNRFGLSGRNLIIEITEGVLLAETPKTLAWMNGLRAIGCRVSLDDFGTGFSSLSYLKKFPVDHVKIDKSFVRDMQTDRADRSLVEAILAMARSLDLCVVAEGIETEGQFELLRTLECDFAQGYVISRPVAAELFPHDMPGIVTA